MRAAILFGLAPLASGLGEDSTLSGVLLETRQSGWVQSEEWTARMEQRAFADVAGAVSILTEGVHREGRDASLRTLSECEEAALLDWLAAAGPGPRSLALRAARHAPLEGRMRLLAEVGSPVDLLRALEQAALQGEEDLLLRAAGRFTSRLLARDLDPVEVIESLARWRCEDPLAVRAALQGWRSGGSPVVGEAIAQFVADWDGPPLVVLGALAVAPRGLLAETEERVAVRLLTWSRGVDERVAEAALPLLARYDAGQAAQRLLELQGAQGATEHRVAQRTLRSMGAPASLEQLAEWVESEEQWWARREEVLALVRSPRAEDQRAALQLVRSRKLHKEGWSRLLLGMDPADPRLALELLDALGGLEARCSLGHLYWATENGNPSLATEARRRLEGLGLDPDERCSVLQP